MLEASVQRILAELPDGATVLDVGGGVMPLNRADYVIDLLPYGERGSYGSLGPPPERFTEDTWIHRDICDREPWPFTDKQIDFAVCSHTLEDVRDPIFVCSELNRVAKAGYIEVPSRVVEQTYGWQGPWVGWSHHRWLIDVDGAGLTFVHKSGVLERDDSHFPPSIRAELSEADKMNVLWWQDGFRFEERFLWDAAEFDAYLREPLRRRQVPGRSRSAKAAGRLLRLLGRRSA